MTTDWKNRASSAEEALSHMQSGMRVFVHGASATPTPLLQALCARTDLEQVRVYHLHLAGDVPFARPEFDGRIRSVSLFTGPSMSRRSGGGTGRTSCPSSSPTSPGSSPAGRCRSTRRCCSSRLPTSTGSAPWTPRSTPPGPRPTRRRSSSPRSTSRCPGDYEIVTITDDGIRVWVDDELKLERWDIHGSTIDRIPLTGGRHRLRLEYFEATGWARTETLGPPEMT